MTGQVAPGANTYLEKGASPGATGTSRGISNSLLHTARAILAGLGWLAEAQNAKSVGFGTFACNSLVTQS